MIAWFDLRENDEKKLMVTLNEFHTFLADTTCELAIKLNDTPETGKKSVLCGVSQVMAVLHDQAETLVSAQADVNQLALA